MLGFLGGLKAYFQIGVAILVVLLGSAMAIQTVRVGNLKQEQADLTKQINDMKAAVALTEALRKDNAILTEERNDLLQEIQNAEGNSDPLSPDVLRILERLRARGGTPSGSPR